MKKLEVRLMLSPDNILVVGTPAHSRGRVYFEYSPQFLNDGFDLSPFRLPFEANFRIPSNDYEDLLKVTSILTRNHRDVPQFDKL